MEQKSILSLVMRSKLTLILIIAVVLITAWFVNDALTSNTPNPTMHAIDHVVDGIMIIVFAIAARMAFEFSKQFYGGRFTTLLPPLVLALSLFFFIPIVHMAGNVLEVDDHPGFMIGIQSIQLLAGIFLLQAMLELYKVKFATEGFMMGEKKWKK